MKTLMYTFPPVGSGSPRSTTIQTSLYDLIAAIAAEVRLDEEALVTATAVHALRSHRAKFISKRGKGQTYGETVNYLNTASA
jgi:hypothetical protein